MLPTAKGSFACVTKRFVTPIVLSSQSFQFRKLADESDVPALSNDLELGTAFEL
jgi:hypothetical protein